MRHGKCYHWRASSRREPDWREVLSEAEQVVGYPPSFLNLRWLFNDEVANTAVHIRKLISTDHPLLKSAKNLLIGSRSNLQSLGLIILLVSKAAGIDASRYAANQHDSGVLHTQRALAEIVEMKRTGHVIHRTMVDLKRKGKHGDKYLDLLNGNKIVLLTGDYLLANCLKSLGGLRNNEVTELISTGLRDLVEGDFFGERDANDNPVPSQPKTSNVPQRYDWENEDILKKMGSNKFLGSGRDEWILRTMLDSGSILGKGCSAAMKLAQKSGWMERNAYRLGGHLALLWQLHLDVRDFYVHPWDYSLVGSPVTLALWEYPQIYGYVLEAQLEGKQVEYKQLHCAVLATRAMEYLREFADEELAAVLGCVDMFMVEDAKIALRRMAQTLHAETLMYIRE